MHDLLSGTWGAQIIAVCKQQSLQTIAAALTTFTVAVTLILGVRGSGDSGGITSGDGDGDSGCGGE